MNVGLPPAYKICSALHAEFLQDQDLRNQTALELNQIWESAQNQIHHDRSKPKASTARTSPDEKGPSNSIYYEKSDDLRIAEMEHMRELKRLNQEAEQSIREHEIALRQEDRADISSQRAADLEDKKQNDKHLENMTTAKAATLNADKDRTLDKYKFEYGMVKFVVNSSIVIFALFLLETINPLKLLAELRSSMGTATNE